MQERYGDKQRRQQIGCNFLNELNQDSIERLIMKNKEQLLTETSPELFEHKEEYIPLVKKKLRPEEEEEIREYMGQKKTKNV